MRHLVFFFLNSTDEYLSLVAAARYSWFDIVIKSADVHPTVPDKIRGGLSVPGYMRESEGLPFQEATPTESENSDTEKSVSVESTLPLI